MDPIMQIVIVAGLVALFFYLGWLFNSKIGKNSLTSAEERAKQVITDAEKEAKNIKREKLLEVKDEWYKKKIEFDNEVNQRKQKLGNLEKQLSTREENTEKKLELVLQKERVNKKAEKEIQELNLVLKKKAEQINKDELELNERLEKISGLTSEEAKNILIQNMVEQAKIDSVQAVKSIYDKAKLDAKKDAQKIIIQSIQRTAADHSIESTVSVVQIQNDEMKGRIIGKEGRNIRAFESCTGVDVIVDDTPEAVLLSSFDQFRREVARVSLEHLIADGRIHPARIEEIVEKTRQELEEEMIRDGENTVLQLGIHNMHQELIKHIGRMRYRSSGY
jgi:ribonuclease Y